ncbi:MAG: LUD domain-containing protein [Dysgonamonadaceae bacterium]|jgi:L-lactate dehydrogenase complex protein LldG|nr:LUD domain-containing protein [Dysgonamonadaceae bacterium]
MSSKNNIIDNIRQHVSEEYNKHEMPEITIDAVRFDNRVAAFLEINRFVGGDAVLLKEGEDLNILIKALYPDAVTITSNLPEITISSFNPDETDDPHNLNGVELAVVKGEFGVAENGCVWIPQNVRQKALYFITENLVILLDKNRIVNNMHEAYECIADNDYGFGAFISGPSKTADIEQALVIGAHGAKSVVVILI